MASAKVLGLLSTGAVLAAISIVAVAGPASKSPFATKKPKAWETQATPQPSQEQPAIKWQQSTYPSPQYPTPQYQAPTTTVATQTYQPAPQVNMAGGAYYPGKKPASQTSTVQNAQVLAPQANNLQPSSPVQVPAWANKTYQQKNAVDYQSVYEGTPWYAKQNAQQQNVQYASNYAASQQPVYTQSVASPSPTYAQAPTLRGSSKPSWIQRLGLGNLQTTLSGRARAGVAAVDRSGTMSPPRALSIWMHAAKSVL